MIIRDSQKSVESIPKVLVSSNEVCWVADASVYMLTFVTYAEIVRVQCYQGRNVEMG